MSLIVKLLIVIIIITLCFIIFIKYNSNFFLETYMDKSENKPEVLDENIISSLEYEYNLNVLQDQMKTLISNINDYKVKIDKIHDMFTQLTKTYDTKNYTTEPIHEKLSELVIDENLSDNNLITSNNISDKIVTPVTSNQLQSLIINKKPENIFTSFDEQDTNYI